MIDADALAARLAEYLPQQRWFGAKDRVIARVVAVDQEPIDDGSPALLWAAATVEFEGGGADVYQLVLDASRDSEIVDATADPDLALRLLAAIAPDERVERPRLLLGDQSNTSIVYDERLILKLFRRLGSGPNPDAEMSLAVAAAGFEHVPPVVARWQRDGVDRAVVQRYLCGAVDGWTLAQTSLRALLSGDHARPEVAPGDMAPEIYRLGRVTADLHAALARAYRQQPADVGAWQAAMLSQLDRVRHPAVDRERATAVINALARLGDPGVAIRVHGDYHLGQALRADEGWFVVDFEGEPARPDVERLPFSSPLKDVAGMLRSLQYAPLAAVAVMAEDDGEALGAMARAWEVHNRDAFLEGYRAGLAHRALVPADPRDFATVLAAFELDKALYEVGYEAAHRPDWISIPLDGVRRLLEAA